MSNYESIIGGIFLSYSETQNRPVSHCDFNKHGLAAVYQEIREAKAGTA